MDHSYFFNDGRLRGYFKTFRVIAGTYLVSSTIAPKGKNYFSPSYYSYSFPLQEVWCFMNAGSSNQDQGSVAELAFNIAMFIPHNTNTEGHCGNNLKTIGELRKNRVSN